MIRLLTFILSLSYVLIASAQITQLNGTSSHISGPNCWNGALYISGLVSHKRQALPGEWLAMLKKNCVEVETPEAGDIGRLYHETDGEVHGFIHLNQDQIFAKHGEDAMHGYQIMSYDKMLDQYGRTRNCRMSNDTSPECFHKLKYYHCRPENFIQDDLFQLQEVMEELLFSSETKFSYDDRKCDGQTFQRRLHKMQEMKVILERMQGLSLNSIEKFRLESIRYQLYPIEVSNRLFRCRPSSLHTEPIRALSGLIDNLLKVSNN